MASEDPIFFKNYSFGEIVEKESINVGEEDFAFGCWIKPEQPKYGIICSRDRSCDPVSQFRFELFGNLMVSLSDHNTSVRPGFGENGDPNGYRGSLHSQPLKLGEWHFVLVMRRGLNYSLFVNNTRLPVSTYKTEDLYDASQGEKKPFRVGSRLPPGKGDQPENPFPGQISESALVFGDVDLDLDWLKGRLDPLGTSIKPAKR